MLGWNSGVPGSSSSCVTLGKSLYCIGPGALEKFKGLLSFNTLVPKTGLWRHSQQLEAENLGFTGTFQLPSSSRHCHLPLWGSMGSCYLNPSAASFLSFHPSVHEDLQVIHRLAENLNWLVYRARTFVWREMGFLIKIFAGEPLTRNQDGVSTPSDSQGQPETVPRIRGSADKLLEPLSPHVYLTASLQKRPWALGCEDLLSAGVSEAKSLLWPRPGSHACLTGQSALVGCTTGLPSTGSLSISSLCILLTDYNKYMPGPSLPTTGLIKLRNGR